MAQCTTPNLFTFSSEPSGEEYLMLDFKVEDHFDSLALPTVLFFMNITDKAVDSKFNDVSHFIS